MANEMRDLIIELGALTKPEHGPNGNPFLLASRISPPATEREISEVWAKPYDLPAELIALWLESREIRLFEDVDYGQWGLSLLSPKSSAIRTEQFCDERPTECRPGDVVIGEFLGDSELLVIEGVAHSEGNVLVVLPLDDRPEWFRASGNLLDFLSKYRDAYGEKFWEDTPNSL